MAKVDWITWKTDINEIINPNKINDSINDIFQNYNCYMNSIVYEGINHEIIKGGLDLDSLNIVGISPANDYANRIITSIENIKNTMSSLKTEIYSSALNQKLIEKKQLIAELDKKISEEKKILENTKLLKERVIKSNNIFSIDEIESIIETTNEKIKRLEERKEKAQKI